jgi:rhodanese-related sulfurtransferase
MARTTIDELLASARARLHRLRPAEASVIVVCNEGYQSSLAAATLQDLGFSRATDLDGGFQAWREAGLPVNPPPAGAAALG